MNKVLEVLNKINNHVGKLNQKYSESNRKGKFSIVFRGHSNKAFILSPTLFRKVSGDENKFKYHVGNEHILINEYIKKFPEFSSQPRMNVLADMQHYGLPTRLLDWTRNPLVALYFACSGVGQKAQDGSILCQVKDFHLSPQNNLEVAELLSKIASHDSRHFSRNTNDLVDFDDKNLKELVYLYVSNFNIISRLYGAFKIPDSDPIKSLIKIDNQSFFILDKCLGYFNDDVTKNQFINFMQVLYSPYCFIDAPSINSRIIAQQGLFQIFAGKHYDGYDGKSYKVSLGQEYIINESEQIIISAEDKMEILSTLDRQFNINESTLYLKDKQQIVDELKSELKILN